MARRPDPRRDGPIECGWCGRVFRVGRSGRMPKWCSSSCRHRAWEQARAAASGRCAVEVVDRHVEVPVIVKREVTRPTRGLGWLAVLNDLTRQLDTGRLYDRDLPAVVEAINSMCDAAERRLRHP